MWIERSRKKASFINDLTDLQKQVLIVHGARQVGKTSFILNALEELSEYPQLKLNLLYPRSFKLEGIEYLGRDFFGKSPAGVEFLKNIENVLGNISNLKKPVLIFIDEVDRHPLVLESVQTLAESSSNLKFVLTGSNLENIPVKNAATGRKKYFDLYPITYSEFIRATGNDKLLKHLNGISLKNYVQSEYFHNQACELLNVYIRIGGMPKIIDKYLDPRSILQPLPEIVKDLAISIEENVKIVLGEKAKLYEYEDILRKIAFLSMNTLKYSRLQVQYAGRSEAKKLVAKTVGARVAHKIRLFDSERDLSKYIIFDCGITNYLLSGADILNISIADKTMAILYETYVGNELAARLTTRDDLFYWKSGNRAEIEFLLRSPYLVGIDVKTTSGDSKSLNSFALFEENASYIVKVTNQQLSVDLNHTASLPNYSGKRTIPLVTIPHYLTFRLPELLGELT